MADPTVMKTRVGWAVSQWSTGPARRWSPSCPRSEGTRSGRVGSADLLLLPERVLPRLGTPWWTVVLSRRDVRLLLSDGRPVIRDGDPLDRPAGDSRIGARSAAGDGGRSPRARAG